MIPYPAARDRDDRPAPSFDVLAPSDRAALEASGQLNGCGGKGGWFNPPDLVFHEDCMRHDYAYWIGGSPEDRKRADRAFLRDMVDSCTRSSLFPFLFEVRAAVWYYLAVRTFGAKFFNHGIQKTRHDLDEEVTAWARQRRSGRWPHSKSCGCKSTEH